MINRFDIEYIFYSKKVSDSNQDANHPIGFHLFIGVQYLLSMGLYPDLFYCEKKKEK